MMKKDVEISYEALSRELAELVEKLEGGDLAIDEAVAGYERGLQIVTTLEKHLTNAEHTVTELKSTLPLRLSREDGEE